MGENNNKKRESYSLKRSHSSHVTLFYIILRRLSMSEWQICEWKNIN